MPRLPLLLSFLLTLIVAVALVSPAWAQEVLTEDAKLVGSDADSVATAGWSVAAADGLVVMGAWRDDEFGLQAGAAYIFREGAGGWEEEAKLVASDAEAWDTFGWAVAAGSAPGSDVVVVGARGTASDPTSDAAYVFRHEGGGAWVEEVKLIPTDGDGAHDAFGDAVAVANNLALVGAFGADDFGDTSGAAYTFRRTFDGEWIQESRLLASDGAAGDGFGRSVAVFAPGGASGPPIALVGAPTKDGPSEKIQTGATYAFRRAENGAWVEEAKLTAPGAEAFDSFGIDVSIATTPSGNLLALIGAYGDAEEEPQTGAAYVFRREPATTSGGDGRWVFEAKLAAADGSAGQRLGWSVALAPAEESGAEAVAVLGADGAYGLTGTVRLFRRTTVGGVPVWAEEAELWASDRVPGMRLGHGVGASGAYAVAGAPYVDGLGGPAGRGAAYVWDLRRALPNEAPPPLGGGAPLGLVAYPNPSAGAATVALRLVAPSHVRLVVYDGLGRAVGVLYEGPAAVGETLVRLDAGEWAPGVYFLRLQAGSGAVTAPLTILD